MILKSEPMIEYFHDKGIILAIEKLTLSYKKKGLPKWLEVGIIINNMIESLNFPQNSKNKLDFGSLFS